MGARINMENAHDALKVVVEKQGERIKLVEDALEELIQTRVHHVDLTEEVEPDEPTAKRKKAKTRKVAPPL